MVEVPLTDLREGETGIITSIKAGFGHGKRWGLLKRLVDMGLTPGTKVTMVKSAPLNGPVEIYVRGYRLALGRGMAKKITVEVQR
ncbi:MAG: FeoA family protein [Candidatus Bathyarchaeia archaeon]